MSIGWFPGAVVRHIPPGPNDPPIIPRVAILHVDAGNAETLYHYFNGPSGGVESHFHITRTGLIEQYRSVFYQADANLDANDFAVSIETQGFGAGEWTPAQLAAIKQLLRWLNTEVGIPLVQCPKWDGSGVGYHTTWGSPSRWTPVAKSCPGPKRILQFQTEIVPWMAAVTKARRVTRVRKARRAARDLLDTLLTVDPARKGARSTIPTVRDVLRKLRKADQA